MNYAIISDIHGNLEALQTALSYIDSQKIDYIVCLGDIVGYGANPNECLEIVRERCDVVLKGNHDSAAVNMLDAINMNQLAREALNWTHRSLEDSLKEYLNNLPLTDEIENATLVHASPNNPSAWYYIITRFDAEPAFKHFDTPFCFLGHTHRPALYSTYPDDKSSDKKTIINVGSIGQPRDNNPKLSFGIFNSETLDYENVRLAYPVEKAARKIIKAGLPPALAERLFHGL